MAIVLIVLFFPVVLLYLLALAVAKADIDRP